MHRYHGVDLDGCLVLDRRRRHGWKGGDADLRRCRRIRLLQGDSNGGRDETLHEQSGRVLGENQHAQQQQHKRRPRERAQRHRESALARFTIGATAGEGRDSPIVSAQHCRTPLADCRQSKRFCLIDT
jgi:hypothetical protein